MVESATVRNYVTVETTWGPMQVKPEWMIALGAPENTTHGSGRRVYLHGGAQFMVLNTPENIDKLLEREPVT